MTERDDWLRIARRPSGLSGPPPERDCDDGADWDRQRADEEELRRTGVDPVARRVRERAAEATGGETRTPAADRERSEVDG